MERHQTVAQYEFRKTILSYDTKYWKYNKQTALIRKEDYYNWLQKNFGNQVEKRQQEQNPTQTMKSTTKVKAWNYHINIETNQKSNNNLFSSK